MVGTPTLRSAVALVALVLATPWFALGHPRRPAGSVRAVRVVGASSASMGFANRGSLVRARRLEEGPTVRYLPGRSLHWGTQELVGLLERVSRTLFQRHRVRLTVGDLSARNGGPVPRHRSHQSGRDADLAFFARDPRGATVMLQDYRVFGADGRSIDGRLTFDTARNWALVEALLTDRAVRPERIFISTALRARLLAWARAHHARASLWNLAAVTMAQPARVSPHDNHFHVRIPCPADDVACRVGVVRRVHRVTPRRLLLRHARPRTRTATGR